MEGRTHLHEGRAGPVEGGQAAVTGLATVPGGRLLASGDEGGALLVTDLRTTGAGSSATCGAQGLGLRPLPLPSAIRPESCPPTAAPA